MRIVLLVAFVALVSGCIGIPDVFGRDVISVQQSVIDNGVRDAIVVRDFTTIPKSPLLPDQQVLLSFIIENRDSLKSSKAYVDLFNAPTMRSVISPYPPCNFYAVGGTASQRYCVPDQCGIERGGCPVLPGEEKPVNFEMKTPTESDIKNIKTQAKLDVKTTYNFGGALNYIVPAVNTEEIKKRQRAGEKTSLFTTKSHSSGPIMIDVELQGAPYILSNYEAVLLFKIKNRGSGTLVKSQINTDSMEIIFPPEFEVIPDKFSEKFSCPPNSLPDGSTRCINDGGRLGRNEGAIPIYRDESRSSLRFSVRLRDPLLEPFRSFQITSEVKYMYELRNSVDITINPFQNV